MRLPRDLSGVELARRLNRYGYRVTRQTGSHIRLTSSFRELTHHITIPAHKDLKLGTLASIVTEVASYLNMSREELAEDLFND